MKTNPRKVMIIDDDRDFLDEFEEMLSLSGYQTKIYARGEDALKDVTTMMPDIVVLDLRMEGKNGYEVAEEISHGEKTRSIPILAMTGYPEEEGSPRMQSSGIAKCLVKPMNPLNIIAEIEKMVR